LYTWSVLVGAEVGQLDLFDSHGVAFFSLTAVFTGTTLVQGERLLSRRRLQPRKVCVRSSPETA